MSGEPDDAALEAFIGPNWASHYKAAFDARRGEVKRTSLNWAAVLAPLWLAYRRMVLLQVGSFILYVALAALLYTMIDEYYAGTAPLFVAYFAVGALWGLGADDLLLRRARAAWRRATARHPDDRDAVLKAMQRAGGTSLLSAIAVPAIMLAVFFYIENASHSHGHHKAYVAAMKSDLRNLVTAQESYFADSLTYTMRIFDTIPGSAYGLFSTSTGVTITMGVATGTGWNATARHNRHDGMCGIFVGTAPSPVEGANEGAPMCR